MRYTEQRINNTDTYTFESKPSEGLLTLTREWKRTRVEDIDHNWYEHRVKMKPVCIINGGYFGNGPVAGMMSDSGYYNNNKWSKDKKWVTLIYENNKLILDEEWNYAKLALKYPNAVFMRQLGDPLVKDGKRYKGDGRFDHTYSRHPRTFIGQKLDGTIVMFVTDGRGGNDRGYTMDELAKIALDKGCVTAVNLDGGGSSTMALEGVMVNNNENRPVYDAFIFYAKEYNLKIIKPDEKIKIVLDAGHGMATPGKRTPDGVREAQQNYNVMFRLYELLEDDFDVSMTNTNMAWDMPLSARVSHANKKEADLFLSIHKDAIDGKWSRTRTGHCTLVYSKNSKSLPIATVIHDSITDHTGMKDTGIRYRSDIYVLRKTAMKAVLVELGYMDSVEDAKQMYSAEWFDKYAMALNKGIRKYYKVY